MSGTAVPPTVTVKDMSGTFVINKDLSDSSNNTLKLQNVGFIVRQAVNYSTVVVTLKQYTDAEGVVHLDQDQVAIGGTKNNEERRLDGEWGEANNPIWGKIKGWARFRKISDLTDDFLKEGWAADCVEGEVVESFAESIKDGWTAYQIYGFADVNGERKHVRRVVTTKGKSVEKIRMVYDWKPEGAAA